MNKSRKYAPMCAAGAENLLYGILGQAVKDMNRHSGEKHRAKRFLRSEYGQWMMEVASGLQDNQNKAVLL